ncbi:30S ribosomal protein S5 [Mycoplasma sp. SG1]|uniref:30S ribosomal protein S5 n=1 Tax=Mycoplasma sp. SG1 TaxID=2810348 RepID=UPI00202566EA|nr:30S ribosomal protein S5 [Mycoplasma sp. SG1]URM52907.1 30S ribosomal protein S5 [Mycoplasma sp. SG1]
MNEKNKNLNPTTNDQEVNEPDNLEDTISTQPSESVVKEEQAQPDFHQVKVVSDEAKQDFKRQGKPTFEYDYKVIKLRRVVKVVKSGRRFGFTALVVVGNNKGSVGYGTAKAGEVPLAIQKARKQALKNIIVIPINKNQSIDLTVANHYGASKVLIKPAKQGKGIIAGGAVRPVFELAGVKNVYSKIYGSKNPYNVLGALFKNFVELKDTLEIHNYRIKNLKVKHQPNFNQSLNI